MVEVIDPNPQPEATRETVCNSCGARLRFVRRDVHHHDVRDYTGDTDREYFVGCPNCNADTNVRPF